MSEAVMAKRKPALPRLGDEFPHVDDIEDVVETETTTVAGVDYVTIRIPYVLHTLDAVNYQDKQRNRADPGKLTADEMRKLKAIRRGCVVNAETFGRDQEVEKNCHVLRWLLAQIDI